MSDYTWFTSRIILGEHSELRVNQIYTWYITKDYKMPVVSGDGNHFQLPGGKPKSGESHLDTMKRELFEETGITLDLRKVTPFMFGYYLIEGDENWNNIPYLQIRYFLKVEELSNEIKLSINEREDDIHTMKQAQFIAYDEVPKYLPYLDNRPEYLEVIKLVN